MSSLTASATHSRRRGRLVLSLALVGSLATAAFSTQAYGSCEYVVANQWGSGFNASIRITNTGTDPISGWSVSWQYSGDNRFSNGWNADYSGSNPYTASNLSWNETLQPDQTIEIGFQGSKSNGDAEIPVLTGDVCGSGTSSSAGSSSSSSVANSSVSSSGSSSSAPIQAAWSLDSELSYLNLVTTKNTHNVEVHKFDGLDGSIDSSGVARVTIDLDSIDSGVALRDERMRELLFDTATYPTATITVEVPSALLNDLSVGQTTQTNVTASVDLHGVESSVTSRVSVQRLSSSRILVQSAAPVLTHAADFDLTNGVEALRAIVNLTSISAAVPVDFALVFNAH